MPYVPQERREHLDKHIADVASRVSSVGDLTYVIYRLGLQVDLEHPGYANLNAIAGAMASAEHEFRRRQLDPYEDAKIAENGDIARI